MSKVKLPTHPEDVPIPDIETADLRILTEMLYDFYDGIAFTPISAHAVESLSESISKIGKASENKKSRLECLYEP